MRCSQPLTRAGRLLTSLGVTPSRSCSSAVTAAEQHTPEQDSNAKPKRVQIDEQKAGTPHRPPPNMRRPPYYRSTYVTREQILAHRLRREYAPLGDVDPHADLRPKKQTTSAEKDDDVADKKAKEKEEEKERTPQPQRDLATGPRLYDYYEVAKIVKNLPIISEKIDFVNPYERDWSRFEKRWHREWLSNLNRPRKAWSVPLTPRYFETLKFYTYITKTVVVDDPERYDELYKSIVLPTASFEKRVTEALRTMLQEESTETEKQRVSRLLRAMLDDAQLSLAHNREELRNQRVSHTPRCESFWIRAGFLESLYRRQAVYEPKPNGSRATLSRFAGDDIRKLGELSFTMRDHHAAHVRSTERLKPLIESAESEAMETPWNEEKLVDDLYSPVMYNLSLDSDILWQCPGYEPDSGETHMFGRVAFKEVCDMRDQCQLWDLDPEKDSVELQETRREMYVSTAVASLFNWLNGQAHCLGHTQYTDIEEPLVSQLVLSDGKEFFFAAGQLNTIAINIDVPEFINKQKNVCFVDGPHQLYDTFDRETGEFTHTSTDGASQAGLNPDVLSRILQKLIR